jgi:hypothetical protein
MDVPKTHSPHQLTASNVSAVVVEHWQKAFEPLSFNEFEAQALRGFLEEMENLLDALYGLEDVRNQCDKSPLTGWPAPTEKQRRLIYNRTKNYFDTYYGALSHLSSVVSRFSKIFGGKAFSDNAKFVRWMKDIVGLPYEGTGRDNTFFFLEQARLFRALLNHPQQFPILDWSTETSYDYQVPKLVLHGPESRSGVIPKGSSRANLPWVKAAWRFDAPQEASVTNSLANAAVSILASVLADRLPLSTFINTTERVRQSRSVLLQQPR